jgi:predicted peptidase
MTATATRAMRPKTTTMPTPTSSADGEPARAAKPAAAAGAKPAAKVKAPRQEAQSLRKRVTRTAKIDYLLYLPKDYAKRTATQWPLVLFLHGAGERGSDLEQVKKHGIPRRVEEGAAFPFITVSPQCPTDGRWASAKGVLTLEALLDDIQDRYRVDPARVYVTGLSMGGYGTWMLAAELHDRLAAVAPICGGGMTNWARVLTHLPIWVFHGAQDPTVPVVRSEEMVEALKRAGNTSVKLTVYPEAGHDSWTATYNNPAFFDWLLSQRRGKPAQ